MTGYKLARLCGASATCVALLSRRIAEATPAIRTLQQRSCRQQVGALTNEGFSHLAATDR